MFGLTNKCDFKYQKGAKNKEEGNDGKGGGNQFSREGGELVQSHLASLCQLFWKPSTDPGCDQTNSASPSLTFHKSAEAPQLRRPQVSKQPAADIAFKVDAT